MGTFTLIVLAWPVALVSEIPDTSAIQPKSLERKRDRSDIDRLGKLLAIGASHALHASLLAGWCFTS